MTKRLVLEFSKMHGAGNDFIVIDNRFYNFSSPELSELAGQLCARHFSVGADGILAFANPDHPELHDYRMIYYNADGSRGSMCGNGARCLAKFARETGMKKDELIFESDAGVYRARLGVPDEKSVRLYVQPPRHFEPRFRLAAEVPFGVNEVAYVWPGVEHVVIFVDDVASTPVGIWGPRIRHDEALAPAGANVNFVQVTAPGGATGEAAVLARTFEKGVEAETLACGTGAMAAAVVSRLTGLVLSTPVVVRMPGGLLRVGFETDGVRVDDLYLEGPVETSFRGTVYV